MGITPSSVPFADKWFAKIKTALVAAFSTADGVGDLRFSPTEHVLGVGPSAGGIFQKYYLEHLLDDGLEAYIAAGIAASGTGGTQEEVEDWVNGLLVGGTDISLTYDDGAGTLTIDSSAGGGSGPELKGAKAYRTSSDQTLGVGSETSLLWNAEEWDTNSMHDTSTNSHRIEGFSNDEAYQFEVNAYLADGGISSGYNGTLYIKHYDSSVPSTKVKAALGLTYSMIAEAGGRVHLGVPIEVDSGDYVYVTVDNQFDASLGLSYEDESCFFSATRIDS